MAEKLSEPGEGWKVRIAAGEYGLTLAELREWVLSGKVRAKDEVFAPTTRRWKLAENAPELESALSTFARRERDARWAREAPAREAEARARATRQKWELVSGAGIAVAVVAGFLALKLGGEGLAFLLPVAVLGAAVGVFGAVKTPRRRY